MYKWNFPKLRKRGAIFPKGLKEIRILILFVLRCLGIVYVRIII
jgi:hypothetical protein